MRPHKTLEKKLHATPSPASPVLKPSTSLTCEYRCMSVLISLIGDTPRMQPDVCRIPLPARQAIWCLLWHWGQGNSVWPPCGHFQVLADVESKGMKTGIREIEQKCNLYRLAGKIEANIYQITHYVFNQYLDNWANCVFFVCEWNQFIPNVKFSLLPIQSPQFELAWSFLITFSYNN